MFTEHTSKTKLQSVSKSLLLVICSVLTVFISGCATGTNAYSQYYKELPGTDISTLFPYSGTTQFQPASTDPMHDSEELLRNGYRLMGISEFQGPNQTDDALKSQATKVGADVVLYSCGYVGSQQTATPYIQYHSGQTFRTTSSGTVNANAWGNGGYAYGTGNYHGSSTTTTPGTYSTEMVPVTAQLYQYETAFFRKAKPPILGVLTHPLSGEIRAKLQRNAGVFVWIVINKSPAFNANILEGDIILKMNGEEVPTVDDFSNKIAQLAGQKVNLEIVRNGETKNISVQFNNFPN